MGLSFNNKTRSSDKVSSCANAKLLTSENIKFLKSLGFTITDYGNTGHKKRSNIRRNSVGEGVSHAHPLRFIEIGK